MYYLNLAIKDLFRLWPATRLQVIIVAGVCFPILILLGFKNGQVEELRHDLETEATARRIKVNTGPHGAFFDQDVIDDLCSSIPNIDLIIPTIERDAFITKAGDPAKEEIQFSLKSTVSGDPLLQSASENNSLTQTDDHSGLVLKQSAAEKLGVTKGDLVAVTVVRKAGDDKERHTITLPVSKIMKDESNTEEVQYTAYLSLEIMKLMEIYGTGSAVPEWNVPAMKNLKPPDTYSRYAHFCFRGASVELQKDDHEFLKKKRLVAREFTGLHADLLYNMLKPSARDEIIIYEVTHSDNTNSNDKPVRYNPLAIPPYTAANADFLTFWEAPREVKINGTEVLLVGISLPIEREMGNWIQKHVKSPRLWFDNNEASQNPLSARMSPSLSDQLGNSLSLQTARGASIKLLNLSQRHTQQSTDEAKPDNTTKSLANAVAGQQINEDTNLKDLVTDLPDMTEDLPVVYVPISLMSYLRDYEKGKIKFDNISNSFAEIRKPIAISKARIYTKTIDDIPQAVRHLIDRRYQYSARLQEIDEIHAHTSSLDILVYSVAFAVFFFGVVTVFSVLVDSTDRKKGTIGIFRVMGVTRFGVFCILIYRAIAIGIMAALACTIIGFVLSLISMNTSRVHNAQNMLSHFNVILTPFDYAVVAGGSVLCAATGVFLPAFRASQLDPFEAITEGHFN